MCVVDLWVLFLLALGDLFHLYSPTVPISVSMAVLAERVFRSGTVFGDQPQSAAFGM